MRLTTAMIGAGLTTLCWISAVAGAATPGLPTPGIDWFKGDVDAAFAAAAQTHRPVFLYWGAKWCPPCQQLKSSVFARADFIEKSRQFIAVYLDGDEPRAQRWGQTFAVGGYPTVVILGADRQEITRISGGMDLGLYADLLDIALSDATPISRILESLQSSQHALSHTECRRLAYYAWDLRDYSDENKKSLASDLHRSASACTDLTTAEHARLVAAAANLAPDRLTAAEIVDIVGDRPTAIKIADALEGLGEPFFAIVKTLPADASTRFQRDWSSVLQTVAADPALIDADRLSAIATRLAVLKYFSADGKLPPAAADEARSRAAAALAKRVDPYVRTSIVNAASGIYSETGDRELDYALLKGELATSKTPYYYMADLAEIEEERGNTGASLQWHERAYRESQGAATRFQWGSRYLSALLRMSPTDLPRIRAVAHQVIAELDGADRIQARSRVGLAKLDTRLRQWNDRHERDVVVQSLRSQMQGICRRLPAADGGVASCRKFLSPA